jgi:Tol biopolymer transport system component
MIGQMKRLRVLVLVPVFLVLVSLACSDLSDGELSEGEQVDFDTYDGDPDWSPDGRLIAFVSTRGGGGIYVIGSDGRSLRRVFRGEAWDVDWSPDGESLAFANERGIFTIRLRERRPRLVLDGRRFSLPAWAPNGRELAVVQEVPGVFPTYDGQIRSDAPAIYVIRLDRGGPRRLLPRYRGAVGDARPDSIAAVSETEPAWSPDGRSIAFQAGDGQLVTARLKSGDRQIVDHFGTYEPAWSPDGRMIAYQCEGSLCVANADGSNQRRLAGDGGDPSWAPDSRRLVFEHYLYGGGYFGANPQSLSVVDVDGGDLRKLTFGPDLPRAP